MRTLQIKALTSYSMVSRHGAVKLLISQRVPGPVEGIILRVAESTATVFK